MWLDSGSRADDLLVMDLEGTDSGERGEDRTTFERQTALYALALAEVLMINLWEHDIGRYTASNYGVLKTVFEVNLDVFQPSSKTLLMFVVRDHNEEETPFSAIQVKIRAEVERIWAELRKPAQFADKGIDELFDIQYIGLPHKNYQKAAFASAVETLKQRFIDPSAEKYVFASGQRGSKAVPLDGFGHYAEQLWATILTNKALDLPSQREMLATFRCDEIITQLAISVGNDVAPLAARSQKESMAAEFGETATELVAHALQQYKKQTERYHSDVVIRKQRDLYERLGELLLPLARQQLQRASDTAAQYYAKALKQHVAHLKDDYSSFFSFVSKARAAALGEVQTAMTAVTVSPLQFNSAEAIDAFTAQLDALTDAQRSNLLQRLQTASERSVKKQLQQPVSDVLKRGAADLWPQLADIGSVTASSVELQLADQLRALKATDSEGAMLRRHVRLAVEETVRAAVEQHASLLLLHMRNRFDRTFRYDADGVLRRWKPHDSIRDLFFTCKEDALKLLPLFAYWRLPRYVTPLSSSPPSTAVETSHAGSDAEGSEESPIAADDVELVDDEDHIAPEDVILTPAKRSELELQFNHDVEGALRDAELEQERAMQQLRVPMWAIVLMAVLGFDELMAILRNPLLLLLLILLVSGVYLAWTLNLIGPAQTVATAFLRQSMASILQFANQFVDTEQLALRMQQQQQPVSAGRQMSGSHERDDGDASPNTRLLRKGAHHRYNTL